MTSPSTAEPERTAGTPPRAREDAELLLRRLAPHEAQALARLAAGDDLRAMARHLGVAPGTARNHLNRAVRKLGVRNREEAVALVTSLAPEAPQAPAPHSPAPAPATAPAPAPVEFVGPPEPPARPAPTAPAAPAAPAAPVAPTA
ncbi:helix-turn-helix transcriptional regulator, partial [Kitasatospora phosalacinea]|uniref:helix-turn-helix domain-containing protein n=1 Tax=Kitasatospora phosalacinea TaxID=2065 RepID=UPI003655D8D6